jgi:hypothetical protein
MKISVTKRSNARFHVAIDWPELQNILRQRAEQALSTDGHSGHVKEGTIKVELRRETEGSPSYPVDKWSAVITGDMDVP